MKISVMKTHDKSISFRFSEHILLSLDNENLSVKPTY